MKELSPYIPEFYGEENGVIRLKYYDHITLDDFLGDHENIFIDGKEIVYASDEYSQIMIDIIEEIIRISDIFIKYKIKLWDLQSKNILINTKSSKIELIFIDFDGVKFNKKNCQYHDNDNIILTMGFMFDHYISDCKYSLFDPYWMLFISCKESMDEHCQNIQDELYRKCDNVEIRTKIYNLILKLYKMK